MDTVQDILEGMDIVSAIVPVDLQAGANNGDYVNLRDYEGAVVVVFKGAGTAGDDPVITITQASDATGTGAKAVNFTRIKHKVGTLTAVGTWTTMTQTAANTFNGAAGGAGDIALAENQAVVAIDIRAAKLDSQNGFTWIRVAIPDVGANAQVGCAFYILYGGKYRSAAPITAIA